jgi:hemerythrin superfamily protein
MSAGSKNVVELLTDQHRHIEKLFEELEKTTEGTERGRVFGELRRMLSVHEAAEEIVTHPSLRIHGYGDVVHDRLEEEHRAKELLAHLDGTDASSADFQAGLAELKTAVLAHAANEEELEFPLLLAKLDEDELGRMASAVKAVEAAAPTHPHPAAGESAAANTLAGPLVGLLDRVRDAARAARGTSNAS